MVNSSPYQTKKKYLACFCRCLQLQSQGGGLVHRERITDLNSRGGGAMRGNINTNRLHE